MMVDLQKDSAKDVSDALKHLEQLLDNDESANNRKEARSIGRIGYLVTTMNKWPVDESIQGFACRCLMSLTDSDDDAGDVAMARLGGMEAAVSAMKWFQGSLRVQKGCLGLLQNMLSGTDGLEQTLQNATRRFVAEYNGLALVIKAMESFPNETGVQKHGCLIFCNISNSGKYQYHGALLKSGAFSAMARAVEQHPDNEQIIEDTTDFVAFMFRKGIKK